MNNSPIQLILNPIIVLLSTAASTISLIPGGAVIAGLIQQFIMTLKNALGGTMLTGVNFITFPNSITM